MDFDLSERSASFYDDLDERTIVKQTSIPHLEVNRQFTFQPPDDDHSIFGVKGAKSIIDLGPIPA
jgi:hypothetical protein